DAGQTWSKVDLAAGLEDVFFATPSAGWSVGSVGRVLRTTNGGASWISTSLPGIGSTLRAVHFTDASSGWLVGDSARSFKSQDGGASWTPFNVPSTAHFSDVFFADGLRGWIAAGDSVLRTSDGGASWQGAALPAGARADKLSVLGGNWLWATGTPGVIANSNDGGVSWTTQFTTPGIPLFDVSMGDLSAGIAVGVDGCIFRTTNGGSAWTQVAGGSPGATKLVFDVVRRGAKVWAALTNSVILRSTDDGASWTEIAAGLPQTSWRAIDFFDDQVGYAVGERQGFYPTTAWTTDGGLTWQPTYWNGMYDFWDVDALSASEAVACADNGLWRSTNGGLGWSFVNTTPLSGFFGADFIDANQGWAVGYDFMKTIDGGQTWSHVLAPSTVFRDVAFADALHGWAVGDGGRVLATVDGGASWTPQTSGTAADLWTVEALSPSVAWIGGSGGFCARTLDSGASWTPLAPVGFAGTDCYGSSFQGSDDGFLTGYYPTSGIWKRKPPTCGWSNYCQGKLSSNGLVPQLDAIGIPSVAQGSFTVRATQAVPNAVGLVIYSKTGIASLPFGGAILCVAPPITRLPAQVFGSSGSANFVVGVSPAMSATSRWYQLWQRDSHHPDGTGMTLSDGLVVNFCP
ncbi:MAG: YCF48-related protein, partial [Chloroflexota bacterium]